MAKDGTARGGQRFGQGRPKKALKEKLETESNTLCDRLYAEWCKAAPAEKRALAEKILRKALPDTAYHEWAEKQLSGQQ